MGSGWFPVRVGVVGVRKNRKADCSRSVTSSKADCSWSVTSSKADCSWSVTSSKADCSWSVTSSKADCSWSVTSSKADCSWSVTSSKADCSWCVTSSKADCRWCVTSSKADCSWSVRSSKGGGLGVYISDIVWLQLDHLTLYSDHFVPRLVCGIENLARLRLRATGYKNSISVNSSSFSTPGLGGIGSMDSYSYWCLVIVSLILFCV